MGKKPIREKARCQSRSRTRRKEEKKRRRLPRGAIERGRERIETKKKGVTPDRAQPEGERKRQSILSHKERGKKELEEKKAAVLL